MLPDVRSNWPSPKLSAGFVAILSPKGQLVRVSRLGEFAPVRMAFDRANRLWMIGHLRPDTIDRLRTMDLAIRMRIGCRCIARVWAKFSSSRNLDSWRRGKTAPLPGHRTLVTGDAANGPGDAIFASTQWYPSLEKNTEGVISIYAWNETGQRWEKKYRRGERERVGSIRSQAQRIPRFCFLRVCPTSYG
jgi:hypothetical protein